MPKAKYFRDTTHISMECDCGNICTAPGKCAYCGVRWAVNSCIVASDESALYAWVVKALIQGEPADA